ncbi:putative U11/U12 small nuclear ribonucleoprotein 25kDa protein [Helianthus annuus]|nr:putative U11/U12 small nuclear ribonucleoprotein 25kDa protein [Helianthus annuus]
MPSITHDNRNPKLLFHNSLILRGLSCSYPYHKLPKTRLKLSVLKLDGSSFGVEVPMSATVAELKLALEEFFNLLPKDERCVISW